MYIANLTYKDDIAPFLAARFGDWGNITYTHTISIMGANP